MTQPEIPAEPDPESTPEAAPTGWEIPTWLGVVPAAMEPDAAQRAFAKHLRGLFLAFVAEGFTEPQALTLVQTTMGGFKP